MPLQNAFESLAVESKQDAILTELEKKADLAEAQPVNVENQLDISALATSAKQLPNNHDVNVTNQLTGYATSAKQLPDGHNVTVLNPTVAPETGLAKENKQLPDNHQVIVSNQITGFSTATKQDDLLTELQKKADVTETQPVSVASLPLPVGIATAANQTNGTQSSKFVDENGVAYGVKHIDNKPRISSMPYLYDIAELNVVNHVAWTKNGYNGTLSSTEQTLWAVGGDYIFPTAQMQMEVVSSSASDTSAGTGARTVEVFYLDNTLAECSEIITLNGVTPVATTATNIYRINAFRVKTTGAGLQNAGNIDIRNLTDTHIYSRIAAGVNRALNCVYTVPANKTLYVVNLFFSGGANVANRPIRVLTKGTYDTASNSLTAFFMPYTNAVIVDGSVDMPLEVPSRFPAGTDIKINAISPDGASYGAVIARGWLESN